MLRLSLLSTLNHAAPAPEPLSPPSWHLRATNTRATRRHGCMSSFDKPGLSPLPPPPRRPPQAQLAPTYVDMVPAGGSYIAGGFRSSALAKVSRIVNKSSEYLGPKVDAFTYAASSRLQRMEGDWDSPSSSVVSPQGLRTRDRQASVETSSSMTSSRESTAPATPGRGRARARWGISGTIGYLLGREGRGPVSYNSSEERIACFPGWATLQPSTISGSEPALCLDILTSGYAYRLRPIAQASRSQRVFYSLARSFAALPRVPPHLLQAGSLAAEAGQSVDALAESLKQSELGTDGNVFERLMEIGGDEAVTADGEPQPEQGFVAEPADLSRPSTPPLPPSSSAPPSRHPSMMSLPSKAMSTTSSRASSIAADPKPSHEAWPKPFSYTQSDLPRLHENLQRRLLPFFGLKLPSRRIRLSVYPASEDWEGGPIASKLITTKLGGSFKTSIQVQSEELKAMLSKLGNGVEALEGMQVRVVAELLEIEPENGVIGGQDLVGDGMRVTADDEVHLSVGKDGGVRVISDIDDTVKFTEVLGSTKNIFRNVFVRELDEICVPGMASWYRAMEDLGAEFHYVSNSPWELSAVIRDYLSLGRFPVGSITLKEYGGASSAIAKLWEEPGMRKRAGVEAVLKEFPHSRFILIGDSGEKDLDLYVQLASEYPKNVLAVFIRDVTTPFNPDAHPKLPQHKSTAPERSFSEFPDLPGAFDGSHESPFDAAGLASTPALSSSAASSRPSTPPPRPLHPVLEDPTTDFLSPNNPLRSATLPPSQNEQGETVIEAFYMRIAAAERILPRGIPLRIFRHGRECREEALEIIRGLS